MNSQIQIN